MPVDPLDPSHLPRRPTSGAGQTPEADSPSAGDAASSDTEARSGEWVSAAHPGGAPEAPPSATLAPERLRRVLERLAAGFYHGPEVIDHLAWHLTDELGRERGG